MDPHHRHTFAGLHSLAGGRVGLSSAIILVVAVTVQGCAAESMDGSDHGTTESQMLTALEQASTDDGEADYCEIFNLYNNYECDRCEDGVLGGHFRGELDSDCVEHALCADSGECGRGGYCCGATDSEEGVCINGPNPQDACERGLALRGQRCGNLDVWQCSDVADMPEQGDDLGCGYVTTRFCVGSQSIELGQRLAGTICEAECLQRCEEQGDCPENHTCVLSSSGSDWTHGEFIFRPNVCVPFRRCEVPNDCDLGFACKEHDYAVGGGKICLPIDDD